MTPQEIPHKMWPALAWAEVDLQLALSKKTDHASGPTQSVLKYLKLPANAQGLTRLQELLSELRKELE